ncbi:MAG: hypothetical protein Q9227_001038 [Pyrenula ochraceoflavens]
MDFIEDEEGQMLSETWNKHSNDRERKRTFFRDLSRILLSSIRTPLPYIGSLTINDQGIVSLANRPLSLIVPEAENDCCPPVVSRNHVYNSVEAYIMDLFNYHDSRIRYQPNSVISVSDGFDQIHALTLMRTTLPDFLNRDTRFGPFYLNLDDLHQSNIFVDESWHIKFIIDLEWACFRPIEMFRPPIWLTGQGIDLIVDEKASELKLALDEFLSILEEEETKQSQNASMSLAKVFRESWSTGRLWYYLAIDSLTALHGVFWNQVQPMFPPNAHDIVARYWHSDAENVIEKRAADKIEYDKQLRQAFEEDTDLED